MDATSSRARRDEADNGDDERSKKDESRYAKLVRTKGNVDIVTITPVISELLNEAPYPLLYPGVSHDNLANHLNDLEVYAQRPPPPPSEKGKKGCLSKTEVDAAISKPATSENRNGIEMNGIGETEAGAEALRPLESSVPPINREETAEIEEVRELPTNTAAEPAERTILFIEEDEHEETDVDVATVEPATIRCGNGTEVHGIEEIGTEAQGLLPLQAQVPPTNENGTAATRVERILLTIDRFFFPDVKRKQIKKKDLLEEESSIYNFIFVLTVCGLVGDLEVVVQNQVDSIKTTLEKRSERAKKTIVVLLLAMRLARRTVNRSKRDGRSEKTLEVYRECQTVLDDAAYNLLRYISFKDFPTFCKENCLSLFGKDIVYVKRLLNLSLEAQAKVFLSHSYWDEFYNWKWYGRKFGDENGSRLSLQWKFRTQLMFMIIFAFVASLAVGSGYLWEDMRTHLPQEATTTSRWINYDHICLVIVYALFVPSTIVYEFKEYDAVFKYLKFHRTKMAILIVWVINLFVRIITCPWLMEKVDFTEYGYVYFNKFWTYALYITIAPYMLVHIGNAMNMQMITRLMGKNLKQLSFFGLFFLTCSCFHSTLVYALRFSNDDGVDDHEHTTVWILFEAVAFEIFGEPSEAIREGTFPSTSKCKPELSSFTVVRRLFQELKNHTTTKIGTLEETNAIRKQLDEAISCNLRSTLMPIFLFLFLIIIVVILMNIVQAVISDYNEKLQKNSAHYSALYRMRLLVNTERSCSAIFSTIVFIKNRICTSNCSDQDSEHSTDKMRLCRFVVWLIMMIGGSSLLISVLTLLYVRKNNFEVSTTPLPTFST